ncbi:MAG TPA: patatin-like phospholipase family protein [Roseiflexaceae bacterium]|nr:patatin-like phospholipase family protein [Roseiflexaceae bacterium]
MPAYRILSLDGGGIRGAFTARLLARLDGALPGFLQRFDLFAGTSTGGILALGLAAGLSPDELVDLYRDNGAAIFDDSWLDNLKDLGNVAGAQYSNTNLTRVLSDIFAKRNVVTLDDLPKRVLIPSFDLDDGQDPRRKADKPRTWKPKFFHNYPGADSDGAERIVDVAMRTSAAPTYFPSYGRFIDGGVVANNPSMAALAQALNDKTGKQQVGDVCMLSLGTGTNPTFIAGDNHDWGVAQWARPIISLMMDGGMGVADYECAQILDSRYHRLSCILDEVIPLDCYQKVDILIKYADAVDISATVAWLGEHVVSPSIQTLGAPPKKRKRRTG